MIQRIQTLYLALAAICLSGTFAISFAHLANPTNESRLFGDGRYDLYDHPVLLFLSAVAALSAAVAIFLFKNRPIQMRATLLSLIATLALITLAVALLWFDLAGFGEVRPTPEWGSVLPVAAALLLLLAQRHIKKDEELVRSMDRLR